MFSTNFTNDASIVQCVWFKIKYLDLKYENIVCISVMSGQNLNGVTQNPMLHCDKIG